MSAQLSTASVAVRFGTYGWEWPSWSASYYPEDLPEDWRAAYYANDALCVCLPPSQWLQVPAERVSAWCEGLREEFRFVLELDAAVSDFGRVRTQMDRFGERVATVLCARADQIGELAGAGSGGSFELLVPADAAGLSDALAGAWHAVDSPQRLRAAVVDLDPAQKRQWRDALEALAPRIAGSGPASIFVRGPAVTPALVREFRVLAELMGLA